MVKSAAELVHEANAQVEKLNVEQARSLGGADDVLFVDVRETPEVARGKIPGALHAPRGLLEFFADPGSPMHKPELGSGKRLVLYCGTGGRSALAAKTLKDMGIPHVSHMLGGFSAWQTEGGDVET